MSIIGYKKVCYYKNNILAGHAIAILEIPKANNRNTMSRTNIKDPFCAKYRCERAYVLKMFDIETGERVEKASSCFRRAFIYRIGEWVESGFDSNIENVCGPGIHYFISIECAKYFNIWHTIIINNKEKCWYDNGLLSQNNMYLNGVKDGLCEKMVCKWSIRKKGNLQEWCKRWII